MKIELNHLSNEESNLFLRCFYSRLREYYGKCAWVFMPSKNSANTTIRIGTVDIGIEDHNQDVTIKYSKKGVIKELFMNNPFSPNTKELDDELYEVATSLDTTKLTKYSVSSIIETPYSSIANINTDGFYIFPDSDSRTRIAITVPAFDPDDAAYLSGGLINEVCNFLSICLNTYVKSGQIFIGYDLYVDVQNELYSGDEDWIDDHPMVNGSMALSEDQVSMVIDIIAGNVKPEFLSACAHFNNAVYLLKDHSLNQNFLVDAAAVLYISSLEVCSSLFKYDSSSCSECGQVKYSIRKRVLDLVGKYHPEHLKKFIDRYYQGRSKYLHAGSHSSSGNYYGVSIPQLDPSSYSGCHAQASSHPINLRDFTSYIFRKVSKERELTRCC